MLMKRELKFSENSPFDFEALSLCLCQFQRVLQFCLRMKQLNPSKYFHLFSPKQCHQSGHSFQKCARTEQEENFEEENVNSNENLQKGMFCI
jgi:hypothetical protein